jgi:hypothetical protein
MKLISFVIILCLLGMYFSMGCNAQEDMERENGLTQFVSQDPEACKSIKIDCTMYNNEQFKFAPFSGPSGCGCKAYRI